jgi:ribonucleoside-diphosphate reductase alpha chain
MRGKTARSRIPGKISCARPFPADRTFLGRVAGLPAWEGRYTRVVEFPTSDPSPDMPTNLLSRREVLTDTRRSVTHKFSIGGHEGYLTIGLFDDGRPGEIFIKMSKEGSTLSGLIQGFCRAFSLCLQHGLRVEEAVERFRGMRFEPMGATSNPEIPECSSILDYVARYLEHEFVERE